MFCSILQEYKGLVGRYWGLHLEGSYLSWWIQRIDKLAYLLHLFWHQHKKASSLLLSHNIMPFLLNIMITQPWSYSKEKIFYIERILPLLTGHCTFSTTFPILHSIQWTSGDFDILKNLHIHAMLVKFQVKTEEGNEMRKQKSGSWEKENKLS